MTVREQMLHYRDMHIDRALALEDGKARLPEPSPEQHMEYAGHYERWVAEVDALLDVGEAAQELKRLADLDGKYPLTSKRVGKALTRLNEDSGSGETVAGSVTSERPRTDRQADVESTDSPHDVSDSLARLNEGSP